MSVSPSLSRPGQFEAITNMNVTLKTNEGCGLHGDSVEPRALQPSTITAHSPTHSRDGDGGLQPPHVGWVRLRLEGTGFSNYEAHAGHNNELMKIPLLKGLTDTAVTVPMSVVCVSYPQLP